MLQTIQISKYVTSNKQELDIYLTYEVFGQPLHTAPVVMVNHALTGNSTVIGKNGWWNGLIGAGRCIDTDRYTIIAFNIPGNGYSGLEEHLFEDYQLFKAQDIASVFIKGLEKLGINHLYAVIGGSIGGGIAWELAAQRPELIQHLIPVATDWKSTDWLKANCQVQQQILLNSNNPVHDARLHAMLVYRTPRSLKQKFDRSYNDHQQMFNVESWLLHHGKKLDDRFTLSAYKLLNYILANIDITGGIKDFEDVIAPITSTIHMISVDSDLFFTLEENQETYQVLKRRNKNAAHHVIKSMHGHDAFLMEIEQLTTLLTPVFKKQEVIKNKYNEDTIEANR